MLVVPIGLQTGTYNPEERFIRAFGSIDLTGAVRTELLSGRVRVN